MEGLCAPAIGQGGASEEGSGAGQGRARKSDARRLLRTGREARPPWSVRGAPRCRCLLPYGTYHTVEPEPPYSLLHPSHPSLPTPPPTATQYGTFSVLALYFIKAIHHASWEGKWRLRAAVVASVTVTIITVLIVAWSILGAKSCPCLHRG